MSSSSAKTLQAQFAPRHQWCPICRTPTGKRAGNAPMQCNLCEDRGVIERDPRRSFCAKCRTKKGAPSTRVATSTCEACGGLGMVNA